MVWLGGEMGLYGVVNKASDGGVALTSDTGQLPCVE